MSEIMFARHQPDGEAYAIQVDGDNVLGICGPLHYSDLWQTDYHWDAGSLDWCIGELGAGHFAHIDHA